MAHYLIIELDDQQTAETLASSISKTYMWLRDYEVRDNKGFYYELTDFISYTHKVTFLAEKED